MELRRLELRVPEEVASRLEEMARREKRSVRQQASLLVERAVMVMAGERGQEAKHNA